MGDDPIIKKNAGQSTKALVQFKCESLLSESWPTTTASEQPRLTAINIKNCINHVSKPTVCIFYRQREQRRHKHDKKFSPSMVLAHLKLEYINDSIVYHV